MLLACCAAAHAALDEPAQLAPSDISIVREYAGVNFDRPLWFAVAPGDSQHYFVAEQDGRILSFNRAPSTASATLFLDIRDRVTQLGQERGLLGLVFDPGYATNGRFYVNYNTDTSPMLTAISRFTKPSGSANADPNSELRLLTFQQPGEVHKAGWIAIGPDGKLYTSSGDGGLQPDATNTAQRLDSLLGKIIRIERSGAIPSDNPFVGTAGARGEIWAYGLRNPFRSSFDSVTGILWAGDVGGSRLEEIDQIVRGRNYGWPTYEGTLPRYNPNNVPFSQFQAPLFTYPHTEGCAIIGGAVYRGAAIPALQGRYVYTDFCSGTLWALQMTNGTVTSNIELGTIDNPSSIGQDEAGELRVTTLNGTIYRIAPGSGSTGDGFPALLSQTGVFVGSSRVDLQACKLEYSIVSPK